MLPLDLHCPACGRRMEWRLNRRSGERFYGCTGYPGCSGIIPSYPDGGVRACWPCSPRVAALMLHLKHEGADRIERSRRAGRIGADEDLWFNLLLADADNLVELGAAQAIVRKGT
jgi:ssDNA-binding Zn-finger/Zn-ribbon topoisomerase 1